MSAGPSEPLSDRWRYVTPALGFLALAALVAYRELSRILSALHLPGEGSYGISSLANLGFHKPHSSTPRLVFDTWDHAGFFGDLHPDQIVRLAMYVDFGFLVLYSALFALWLVHVGRGIVSVEDDAATIDRHAERRARQKTGGARASGEEFEHARRIVSARIATYVSVVKLALVAVPLLALADFLENVFTLEIANSDGKDGFWPLWTFALIKTLLFLFVAASAAIVTLALVSLRAERRLRFASGHFAIRAQVLVVAAFAGLLLFDPTGQASDAVRHWEPNYWQAVAPLVLTLLLAALVTCDAQDLLSVMRGNGRRPRKGYRLWHLGALGLCGVVLVGAGIAAHRIWAFGIGLVVLGGIVAVVAGLSALVHKIPPEDPDEPEVPTAAVAVLAALPPIALGVLIVQSAFSEFADSDRSDYDWLIGTGLAVQLIGWYLFVLVGSVDRKVNAALAWALRGAAIVVPAIFFFWTIVDPWSFGSGVGTIGVFCGAALAVAIVASGLVWLAEWLQPPQAFLLLRLRRSPVFALVLIWAVIAALVDRTGTYSDVRTVEAAKSVEQTPCVAKPGATIAERVRCHDLTARGALDRWLALNAPAPASPKRKPMATKPAIPLVFVAAEGGGIRAGYWTAIVLRCVLEGRPAYCPQDTRDRRNFVFAASGVSGGALGLVTYATHLEWSPGEKNWPKSRLDADFAAPMLDWALFVDLPLSFVRRGGGTDRAEVLERAWEQSWQKTQSRSALAGGFYGQWQRELGNDTRPHVPLLLLNGTRVQDGCRQETSVVLTAVGSRPAGPSTVNVGKPLPVDCRALGLFEQGKYGPGPYVRPGNRQTWTLGATTDLASELCPGDDVRLSTAALLAARFPFVTPSGRLARPKACGGGESVNVVDGGYFENSGTSTITELWQSLRSAVAHFNATSPTCVVPVLLEIDNHYFAGRGPQSVSRPWESSVPFQTLLKGRDARDAQARQAAALSFGHANFDGWRAQVGKVVVDRFAQIFPLSHPGIQAPLGWTLSSVARDDLDNRLELDTKGELTKIRRWFKSSLRCRKAGS